MSDPIKDTLEQRAAENAKTGDPVRDQLEERVAPRYFDADGHACFAWNLTSCKLTDPVILYVPPSTIIPVVFVPGIMGSNLKAKDKVEAFVKVRGNRIKQVLAQKGDRIWDVDQALKFSLKEGPVPWMSRGPAERQLLLNKDVVDVDERGHVELRHDEQVIVLPVAPGVSEKRKAIREARLEDKRRRGWGTVSWYSYGPFLNWLDEQLNGVQIRQGKPNAVLTELLKLAGSTPKGADKPPSPLTEGGLKKLLKFRFPIHAVGYNWLQSNLESGRDLAKKITEIKNRYNNAGYDCDQVIVITHSMGGLVTRAASKLHGAEQDILAVIHGVMPTDGAALFYKRLVGGGIDEGAGLGGRLEADITSLVLGRTAQDTTPVLAYAPGPLELAPNHLYNGGKPWLFVRNKHRQEPLLKALPLRDTDQDGHSVPGSPYRQIYRAGKDWWRAINPAWLNPAGVKRRDLMTLHDKALSDAEHYHIELAEAGFHPHTYAHYGLDGDFKIWGTVTWQAASFNYTEPAPGIYRGGLHPATAIHPTGDPKDWSVIAHRMEELPQNEGAPMRFMHDGVGQIVGCRIAPAADPGDGTVPGKEGADGVRRANPRVLCITAGHDHQGSYGSEDVRQFVLDAVVRAIADVKVPA